jgi:hypothetical protein
VVGREAGDCNCISLVMGRPAANIANK